MFINKRIHFLSRNCLHYPFFLKSLSIQLIKGHVSPVNGHVDQIKCLVNHITSETVSFSPCSVHRDVYDQESNDQEKAMNRKVGSYWSVTR